MTPESKLLRDVESLLLELLNEPDRTLDQRPERRSRVRALHQALEALSHPTAAERPTFANNSDLPPKPPESETRTLAASGYTEAVGTAAPRLDWSDVEQPQAPEQGAGEMVAVPVQHPRSVQWVLESVEAGDYVSYQEAWKDLLTAAGADVPAHPAPKLEPMTAERRDALIDAKLAEYNYPANTRNAARAGWYACAEAHGMSTK